MADITFPMSEDQTEVIFSANTPRGEAWMGTPEVSIPVAEASDFRTSAEGAGLTVAAFP
jgi:hypothetical protein